MRRRPARARGLYPDKPINPARVPNLPFDTAKDLVPVSLVAHSAQPYSDFAGFVTCSTC